MPRKERVARGVGIQQRTGNSGEPIEDVARSPGSFQRVAGETASPEGLALLELLVSYAEREDGYLRTIPDGEYKFVYLKWKFTRGKFSGKYAFVSGASTNIASLMWTLREHIDDIYAGRRNPHADRDYRHPNETV